MVPPLGSISDYLEPQNLLSSQRIPPSNPNVGRSNESINSQRKMGLEDRTSSLRPRPCYHDTYVIMILMQSVESQRFSSLILPTSIDLGASKIKPNIFQEMEVFKSRDAIDNPTTEPIPISNSLCKEVEWSMFPETGEPSGVKTVSMIKLFGVEVFENHVGPILSHVAYSDELSISYNALPLNMALSEPYVLSEPSKSTKPSECSVSDGFLAQSSTSQPVQDPNKFAAPKEEEKKEEPAKEADDDIGCSLFN